MSIFEIPLIPSTNQKLRVSLNGTSYTLICWWNKVSNNWILDIYNAAGNIPILCGTPLITGADLLEQYEYLDIGGRLVVFTIAVGHPPDEVPKFDNLGTDGRVFFATAP